MIKIRKHNEKKAAAAAAASGGSSNSRHRLRENEVRAFLISLALSFSICPF
jgi:hypothetical protein